jgi:hypothetical protein
LTLRVNGHLGFDHAFHHADRWTSLNSLGSPDELEARMLTAATRRKPLSVPASPQVTR